MPFFEYRQNNSGGSFDFDAKTGIGVVVSIEAPSATMANAKAEEIGLYFDGRGDCSCCGDRWYAAWGEDGTDVPTYHGKDVSDGKVHGPIDWSDRSRNKTGAAYGYIHYLDGRVVPLLFEKGSK